MRLVTCGSLCMLLLASGCGGAPTPSPAAEATTGATEATSGAESPEPSLCRPIAISEVHEAAQADAEATRRAIDEAEMVEILACAHETPPGDLRSAVLALVADLHDPRTFAFCLETLAFEDAQGAGEAAQAARALRDMPLDEARQASAIQALDAALARAAGDSGAENRLRIEALRTLGGTNALALPALVRTATTISEQQSFLINRLAIEQLARLEVPEAIPTLLEGLVLFDPGGPMMRANDLAAAGLVALGAVAVPPLLDALALRNPRLLEIAGRYIEAVRSRSPEVAATMSAESIVIGEASYALGQVGSPLALDALVAEVTRIDPAERARSATPPVLTTQFAAALALVSIRASDAAQATRIRETLRAFYGRIPSDTTPGQPSRPQLLVAMQHLADPRLYDFLLAQARRPRRGAEDVDVRVIAARAALRSAAGNDLAPLEALWNAEPDGDVRDALEMMGMPGGLALHRRCLRDTACWAAHLHDEASTDAQTAAAALAILGQTDAAALPALEAALDVRDEEVFVEILYAIDRVAVNGSPSIVTALDRMRTDLLGTRFYSHMQPLVIAVLARLAHR